MQSILELRHLRTLLAIRDTGNLTRAAERLFLTQSALSHQLRLLEEHFALPLVMRKSSPLKLTPAGDKLAQLADAILPQVAHAERAIAKLREGEAGQLRIAVECHTCFDWLMPAMDTFRTHWPEVELDIVSGFHADPVSLLYEDRADLAIISEVEDNPDIACLPLFSFDMVALLANDHPLTAKPRLEAADFATETLITYPVADEMLDLVKKVLKPAGIKPQRRTSELTVAILQLVASRRGIAALPRWSVQHYLEKGYVTARPITANGLIAELHVAVNKGREETAYVADFVQTMREVSVLNLPGVTLL
ncbi:LysR family transcriptional regulator, regulator for metE and metH [Formivibrio citricus]|uniref:HTH-type transcriptional regulator MetR n=1 Tax=Formivibrio citricus TaxID=83765 RepID=A0A1I4YMS1_9NEIS|nr:LysR family transcriptional regulator [Formivibrio citricus]SFN39277.1 LysR family transcriptional regulator, regulator for metE and metH [Formivibrio citricus]